MDSVRLGRRLALVTVLTLASVSLPSVAAAQRVVPPGNSAANQYTETYPTTGGGATDRGGGGRSPAETLGPRNAARLEAMGAQGRAAATVAAATAPDDRAGKDRRAVGKDRRAVGSEPAEPGGSSGLREAAGAATGASRGLPGPLLPLAIAGAALGSLAFLWRRKRRTA